MFTLQQVYCVLLGVVCCCDAFQSPARKTWWAKRVLSEDFYTAGRLNERMIKYASEDGFKSLISLFSYEPVHSTEDATGRGLNYPSTDDANATAALSGMSHVTLGAGSTRATDWMTVETLNLLAEAIASSPKPLIVYDDDSYASTCLLLLYLASQDTPTTAKISAAEVFSVGAGLGFDCSGDTFQQLVEDVTQEEVTEPVTPQVSPMFWYKDYWPAKFLHMNWFVAGQFQSTDLSLIRNAGFTRLFNYRKGKVTGDTPTQEEVTLLNIKDRTGTYTGDGRQSESELLKNRIDPDRSTTYISATSDKNYEPNNTLEYGDEIGYNEETERQDIPSSLMYHHLPIGGEYSYSQAMWVEYGPVHAQAHNASVLVHCRTGFRSSVVSIIQIAYAGRKNSSWALNRLKEVGYDIASKAPAAVILYQQVLDNRSGGNGEKGNGGDGNGKNDGERYVFNWFLVASLSALLFVL